MGGGNYWKKDSEDCLIPGHLWARFSNISKLNIGCMSQDETNFLP